MLVRGLAFLLIAAFGFAPAQASAADLPVVAINEAALPYQFSPANYENSPANFKNAIANYDNADANYDNSEANYDNSPANFGNGRNGSRRLIYNDRGTPTFAGYYVVANNGTTNFFSPRGKRIFYNPKEGQAVFCGRDGSFCGALARVDGKLSLCLTQMGLKLLLLTD